MEPNPIIKVRDRAYELADTGKFEIWRAISRAMIAEGADLFMVRRLDGDGYFKFRLRQRIKAAHKGQHA